MRKNSSRKTGIVFFRNRVLRWFGVHGRQLPWRSSADAWAVFVSEVMLQQTQVARVIPKFEEFMCRWPTPAACAAAPLADVLVAWQGLGYNRRGRNLWLATKEIAARFNGQVPRHEADLLTLPGVGEYTAAAVSAFAYGADAAVCDTNIRRVFSRFFWGGEYADAPAANDVIAHINDALPRGRARDWYGALMDFGALQCTSRLPACAACPLAAKCAAARLSSTRAVKRRLVRRQPAFKGSRREARGGIMRRLAGAGAPLAIESIPGSPADVETIVRELVRDGLVRADGGMLSLPA